MRRVIVSISDPKTKKEEYLRRCEHEPTCVRSVKISALEVFQDAARFHRKISWLASRTDLDMESNMIVVDTINERRKIGAREHPI